MKHSGSDNKNIEVYLTLCYQQYEHYTPYGVLLAIQTLGCISQSIINDIIDVGPS